MPDSASRYKHQRRVTVIGAGINVVLAVGKIATGVVARSNALIADGIHSFSDLATDVVVLFGLRASRRPADETHSYGHGRFETVAALFVGLALVAAGGGIGWSAVLSVVSVAAGAVLPRPGGVALVAAGVSIVAKEALFQWTAAVGRRTGSPVMVANAWHHRSDALSSVGAMVGIGAAYLLGPQWRVLDPIAAVVVGAVIVGVGVQTAHTALREMTDAALTIAECDQILAAIHEVPGVTDPHNLRTRRLGSTVAVEVHIRVDPQASVTDAHQTATEVEGQIRALFGSQTRVITHIEPEFRNA